MAYHEHRAIGQPARRGGGRVPMRDWVKQHPVTAGIVLLTVNGLALLALLGFAYSQREAAHQTNLNVAQLARSGHRLSVALCRDVDQRVAQRKVSDGAAAHAFAVQAAELYASLAKVPRRERDPQALSFLWRIWAADKHAAHKLADRGIQKTITPC